MVDRYVKALILIAGLSVSACDTDPARAQAVPDGPYILFQGRMGSFPVTMMVDEANGSTWYLGSRTSDGQTWSAVPPIRSMDVVATGWVPIGILGSVGTPKPTPSKKAANAPDRS